MMNLFNIRARYGKRLLFILVSVLVTFSMTEGKAQTISNNAVSQVSQITPEQTVALFRSQLDLLSSQSSANTNLGQVRIKYFTFLMKTFKGPLTDNQRATQVIETATQKFGQLISPSEYNYNLDSLQQEAITLISQ